MVSFPYYSHIFRDSYGNGMGIVWGPPEIAGLIIPAYENPLVSLIIRPAINHWVG